MLYEHLASSNAARGSDGSDRSEYGEIGLGVITPHVANLRTVPGHSYGVQSSGGGGGGGVNTGNPAAGTQGSGYKTTGRNTSPFSRKRTDTPFVRRNFFQPTAQGSRISAGESAVPTSPKGRAGSAPTFPTGGLYDAGDERDIGLGSFWKDISRGNISKAFTPSHGIKIVATKAFRVTAATAVGAGTGFITSGGNPLGAVLGGTYGLSKGIRGVVGNAPEGRTLYQTLGPAAALGVAAYIIQPGSSAWLAPKPVVTPTAVETIPNSPLATTTMTNAQAVNAYSPDSVLARATPVDAQPALFPASSPTANLGPLAPASSVPGVGAGDGVLAAAKSSPGFLANAGKTAMDVATLGVVSKLMSPGMTPQPPQQPGSVTVDAAGQPHNQPQPQVVQVPVGGGSGASAPDAGAYSPIEAGISTPVMIAAAGLGVTLLAAFLKRRRR